MFPEAGIMLPGKFPRGAGSGVKRVNMTFAVKQTFMTASTPRAG